MKNNCYHPISGNKVSKGRHLLRLQTCFFLLFFLLKVDPLLAQAMAVNMGTSWLRIPDSAREGAMGVGIGGVPDAFDEAQLNPAGLGLLSGTYLSGSHSFWIQDLSLDHLVFTQAVKGEGFSFGADYLNFGSISTYNVNSSVLVPTGSYTPIAVNAFAAYGFGLGHGLRAGVTGHYIYDNIQQYQPDNTGALDLGLLYQMSQNPLALSIVLSNLGFNIDNSVLPLELKTSAAGQVDFDPKPLQSRLTLATETDLILTNDQFTNIGFGAEYWYDGLMALRAGYRFLNTQDLSGVTGLTAGAAVKFGEWQLDYSFMTLGDLGNTNQIALSLQLGAEPTPTPTPKPLPTVPPTPVIVVTPRPIATPTTTPVVTNVPTPTLTFMDYYRAGLAAYNAKNYQKGLNQFMKALLMRDSTVQPFYYAEACAMIGVIYKFDLPNHFLAHQFCDAALKIDPTTETALKLKHEIDSSTTPMEQKYWDANDAFSKGRYAEAAERLKEIIDAHDPNTPSFYYTEAYSLLGVIYQYHLGDPGLAYHYYQEALKIDPKAEIPNKNIGSVTPKAGPTP